MSAAVGHSADRKDEFAVVTIDGEAESMRVGIDVHMVGEQETGNETYVVNLVRTLARSDDGHMYIAFTPHPSAMDEAIGAPSRAVRIWPRLPLLRVLVGIPVFACRHRIDLLHMTYIMPPVCTVPCVVTVHDLSFEAFPDMFSPRTRMLLSWGVPFSVRRAARVITVSEHTKRDIVTRYGVPEEKIHVTYEAAAAVFQPVRDPERLATVRRRYGIPSQYVLAVGNLEPRKNLGTLLRAFRALRADGRIPHRLVLVGKAGWQTSRLLAELQGESLANDVIWTGYVPLEDLPALYSAAALFVYPSLYEGFGLPPLEAMACGTPVVGSNAAALPEVLGDGALLVSPYDVDGMATAIRSVLLDPGLARGLAERGRDRALTFSWERTARQTVKVYREALDGTNRRSTTGPTARR